MAVSMHSRSSGKEKYFPRPLLPIQGGDRVHVRGGGNLVTLRCGSKAVKVTPEESPYVIPVSTAPPGFVARLGDVLIAVAARLQQQRVKADAMVSLSGRGQEITLTTPLLDEQRSKLRSDATRGCKTATNAKDRTAPVGSSMDGFLSASFSDCRCFLSKKRDHFGNTSVR